MHSAIFYQPRNFHQDLRNFVNKAVIKESDFTCESKYCIELYRFAFQSPKELVYYLVQEGVENKGKIEVISEILNLMPPEIPQYSVSTSSGNTMLITQALMLKLIVIRDSSEQNYKNNFNSLLTKICNKNRIIAKDISLHFLKNQSSVKDVHSNLGILRIAIEATAYENYTSEEKICMGLALCHMASFIYQNDTWDINLTTNLPIILEIINGIYNRQSEKHLLEKITNKYLHKDLLVYFNPNCLTSSLETAVRSLYFGKGEVQYKTSNDIIIELAASLPKLLPKEWHILCFNSKVNGEIVSLFDIVDATQLLVSAVCLEDRHLGYIIQSLGNAISSRVEDGMLTSTNDPNETIELLLNLHSKVCQLIGNYIRL